MNRFNVLINDMGLQTGRSKGYNKKSEKNRMSERTEERIS